LANLNTDVLKYADNYNKFQELVADFMRQKTGNTALTLKTANDEFNKLKPEEYMAIQPELDTLVSNKYNNVIAQIKKGNHLLCKRI